MPRRDEHRHSASTAAHPTIVPPRRHSVVGRGKGWGDELSRGLLAPIGWMVWYGDVSPSCATIPAHDERWS